MKFACKLVRNGNSTQVTIPVRMMDWLQWRCGSPIIVEANIDRTLTIRPPTPADLGVTAAPGDSRPFVPEQTR